MAPSRSSSAWHASRPNRRPTGCDGWSEKESISAHGACLIYQRPAEQEDGGRSDNDLERNSVLDLLAAEAGNLELVAALQDVECHALACLAGQLDDLLLGCLSLLVENRLRLAAIASLLAVVAPLTLDNEGILALLVDRHLVERVLALTLAEGLALSGIVNLRC